MADLTFAAPVTAQLQAQVGAFLQLKQRLFTAQMLAQTPEQQGAIADLIARQLDLEARLTTALQAAANLQAGQISLGDAMTAAGFYAEMTAHLGRAEIVIGGLPAPAVPIGVDWSAFLVWGGLAVGAVYILSKAQRGLWYGALALGGYFLWRRLGVTAP